jgi:hypothetical protein
MGCNRSSRSGPAACGDLVSNQCLARSYFARLAAAHQEEYGGTEYDGLPATYVVFIG